MDISYYKTSSGDRYNILKEKARDMRKKPTKSESIMWEYLKNKQLGVKFRRQHPIGDYIVDFVDLNSKLVIEIDGACHNEANQKLHDEERTRFLSGKGYTVIRFRNAEVIGNIDEVIKKIEFHLLNL